MLKKLKPSVPRCWLYALAGLMWSAIGVMLCRTAYTWLAEIPCKSSALMTIIAIGSTVAVYLSVFSRIAKKNIQRICLISEKACIFAFQAWKGYLIVGLMIIIGISLRSSPIPKQYLAVVYASIGGALLLASCHYYAFVFRLWRKEG